MLCSIETVRNAKRGRKEVRRLSAAISHNETGSKISVSTGRRGPCLFRSLPRESGPLLPEKPHSLAAMSSTRYFVMKLYPSPVFQARWHNRSRTGSGEP